MTDVLESTAVPSSPDAPLPTCPRPLPGTNEPEPVWFRRGRWPLFGWIHRPLEAPAGAVVLCPPLFGEYAATADLYRVVARDLARHGLLAVRVDYEGTGDAGGPSGGPGRLEAWLDGIDQAVDLARLHCAGPLGLFGVRSGALLAAVAAERCGDVHALALWDPWESGRLFLRTQRALQAMAHTVGAAPGDVEVPGYTVDAATVAVLDALRLPAVLRARRAAVVPRPGARGAGPALPVRPAGQAAPTTADLLPAAPGEQEACFEVEPLLRQVPATTAASVVDWLRGVLAAPAPVASGPPGSGPGRRPALDAQAATAVTSGNVQPATHPIRVPPAVPGDVTVAERALWLGPNRLFCMETSPAGVRPESLPTLLFLSSGTDSHIGPARLWVTLSRRLAASGVRCLRVDLSGLGDTAPRPGLAARVIRAPEAFDDVADLVDAVGGPGRTILAGLCSGAYQAFESALELRPLGVIGINPLLRFTPPEVAAGGTISPRRRLCDPRPPWVEEVRQVLPAPVNRLLGSARGLAGRLRPGAAAASSSWLDELALAGVHVYCVGGEHEVSHLPDAPPGGGPEPDMVRVDVVPELPHDVAGAGHRREVTERVTAALGWIMGDASSQDR